MAAIVKSVQKFTVTLGAGTASATEELAAGTVTANCFPFPGTRITTPNGAALQGYATDVYFTNPGGTPTLNVETGTGATRALVVECTIIEVDPTVSNTSVQQGAFNIATSEFTTNVVVDPADMAKAFPIVTWQMDGATSDYRECLAFVEFGSSGTDVDELEIDRDGSSGAVAMSGHWYVVESDEFTIQAVQIYDTSDTGTGALSPSVTLSETACFGSYKAGTDTGAANDVFTIDCTLSTNSIDWLSEDPGGYRQGTWYAVSFDSSVGNVQHGTTDPRPQGADASETVALPTSVDRTRSLVHPTGMPGCLASGSFTSTTSANCMDAFCAWDFSNDGTPSDGHIRVQHNTTGGGTGNYLSWQVIEWELTGGSTPARRVMVIS